MRKNLDNIIIVLYVIRGGVDDYGVKNNNMIPYLKNPDGGGAQTTSKSYTVSRYTSI